MAGLAARIEPRQGFVQRRLLWVLFFIPWWGSLFINSGLGPIVSRTDDITPIVQNSVAFLAAAVLAYLGYALLGQKDASQGSDGDR